MCDKNLNNKIIDSLRDLANMYGSALGQVMNRRKATGGHVEVQVRVREPLGGPQPHTVSQCWLVLDSLPIPWVSPLEGQIFISFSLPENGRGV